MPRTLTVVPTHNHCRAVVQDHRRHGLPVVAYPEHTPDTCANYTEACKVLARGLPLREVLCDAGCRHRTGCPYRAESEGARAAAHAVCTHQRAAVSFPAVAAGREVITLHENAIPTLRPIEVVTRGLPMVEVLALRAADNAAGPGSAALLRRLGSIAAGLERARARAATTRRVPLTGLAVPPGRPPAGVYPALYAAGLALGVFPPPEAIRLALAALVDGHY